MDRWRNQAPWCFESDCRSRRQNGFPVGSQSSEGRFAYHATPDSAGRRVEAVPQGLIIWVGTPTHQPPIWRPLVRVREVRPSRRPHKSESVGSNPTPATRHRRATLLATANKCHQGLGRTRLTNRPRSIADPPSRKQLRNRPTTERCRSFSSSHLPSAERVAGSISDPSLITTRPN